VLFYVFDSGGDHEEYFAWKWNQAEPSTGAFSAQSKSEARFIETFLRRRALYVYSIDGFGPHGLSIQGHDLLRDSPAPNSYYSLCVLTTAIVGKHFKFLAHPLMLTDVQSESPPFSIQPPSQSFSIRANLIVSRNASTPGLHCDTCSRRLRFCASPLNPP
jgi:hypothetical protein